MAGTVGLYLRTLRHLKPWQVVGRLAAAARRKVGRVQVPGPPLGLTGCLPAAVLFVAHDPWNTRSALLEGQFQFLNRTEVLGHPVDWEAVHLPLLWRFNLHYFHYLHLLNPGERDALCRSWVQANPVSHGVGWHPYPTALRVVNWCAAGLTAPDLLASLYRQAAYLYRNLETYVYGNHLLENARALVVAGRFFDGQGEAPQWLDRGLGLYRQETPEQVLPDGGHFERSPMYHALMLEGYLDVLNVLPPDHPDRPGLAETARRMGDVLVALTHPDGHPALFNDATHEIAPPPASLIGYLRDVLGYTPESRDHLPDTGYFVHRDADAYLVIDGGPVGPDYLLAHAHADVFSYELSLFGRPFVVDSGVYEYPAGPMRQYVRSTAAHNTVGVDGVDQVECWGSFRVGRRAAPHDLAFTQADGHSRFEGVFSGYAERLGDDIRHRRCLAVDAEARVVTVEDDVTGRGRHRVESRVHLHPAVEVTETDDGFELRHGGAVCRFVATGGRWDEGWYCPRFGVRHRNRVLVLEREGRLPLSLSYSIRY